MQIPLKRFEQYIDEAILKRGLSYFKNGYVSELDEITKGVYETTVFGTENYWVKLVIENGSIKECVCSCPYDQGPVCKHIVAALFQLEQNVLEMKPKTDHLHSKQKQTAKRAKKKTVSEQVDEILKKTSLDQLGHFIREKTLHDSLFRNTFLSYFAHQHSNESKELYAKQIRSLLRKIAGRDGFIHWNELSGLDKSVNELLATAQRHLENKNYKSAIFICSALMEEMTAGLQFADDSSGIIGKNITGSYQILQNLAKESLPEEIRTILFDYCLDSFRKRVYEGWDWHLDMLQIASEILSNENEAQQLITCLNKAHLSEYEQEEAQVITYTIIKKIKGEKEAGEFLEKNLSNPGLRRKSIAQALKNKDYKMALGIANDGIKQDEKDKPGLAKEWYDWLLKIAQSQNDKEKIIKYSRLLFIQNFRNEQDYYQLMKSNFKAEKWDLFVDELIKDISVKGRWLDTNLIAEIYIQEKWWGRLIKLIAEAPTLQKIENYEKYLTNDYASEIVSLYRNEIIKYMEINTGRNHYKTVCRYLRRIKKLGGNDTVYKIVADFKKLYPQRKALMEELEMI